MSKITFNNAQSPFFKSVKEKVDSYFQNNEIHSAGNTRLFLKGAFQIVTAIALYITLTFFTPGLLLSILLCCALGVNLAIIGFNVMHEGGHQSFSKYKWLNTAAAYFLNILGGNTYYWKIKHNINHHTFTNIEGMDSDIDIRPWMRLNEQQPRYWFHKFQHMYWFFLYGISYAVWIFYDDFNKYFTGRVAEGATGKLAPKEHLIFWVTKIMYLTVYVAVPIFMVGWLHALVGFFIISFVCGLSISIVFQLAHIVECTQFPEPDEHSNKMELEWAVHQIRTTADFATKSKMVSWFLGGLNFQIEHHLFPRVSHIHYPQISKFVKETCQEFNIAYLEYPSMFTAFRSHLQHIRKLGIA